MIDDRIAVYYTTSPGINVLIDIVPRKRFLLMDLLEVYRHIIPMFKHKKCTIQTINLVHFKEHYV